MSGSFGGIAERDQRGCSGKCRRMGLCMSAASCFTVKISSELKHLSRRYLQRAVDFINAME